MASTKVADVYIDIKGDLKDYNASLATAKQGAFALAKEIGTALSNPSKYAGLSPTANLVASLIGRPGGFANALKEAIGQGGFRGVAGELGTALSTSLRNGAQTGFNSVLTVGRSAFGTLKNLAGSVFKGFGLGLGLGAFLGLEQVIARLTHAIPDLINKGRDYANEVDQIVDVTGAGTRESSILASTLNFLGQDVSTVFIRLGQLSKTIQENEVELNRLGVVTRDANGEFLNQVQLLDSVRSAFSKLPDGVRKTRLEILLFGGRGGLGQLVDYLQLTDEQMASLGAQYQKQGLIISDEQRKLGEEAGRAAKNVDNSFTGLATQLFTTVAPQIVAFLDGIAKAVAENAAAISSAIAGLVNTIIGLVQGLTGIEINFNSLTTAVENMTPAVSQSSLTITGYQGQIDAIDKKLKATSASTGGVSEFTNALRKQIGVIDGQIAAIKKWADAQATAFKKVIDALGLLLDAQNAELDAEEKRLARADKDEALIRAQADAQRALAQAIRDRAKAEVAVASARAQLQQDQAAGKDTAQDIIDLADAQQQYRDALQGVADAQQGVADASKAVTGEAGQRARDDRRDQLKGIQDYVTKVGQIADDDNKKAAANTLAKRRARLEEELAAAKAAGRTQEAADLQIKLDAVIAASAKVTKDQKAAGEISALEKRKADLQAEVDAYRGAATTQTEINRAELLKQRADLEKLIEKEKKRVADKIRDDAAEKARLHQLGEDIRTTYSVKAPAAFEVARLAGIKMADDIKKAIGGLLDVFLGTEASPGEGKQGPTKPRSGGLLGALGSVAGALGGLAGIVNGALNDIDFKKALLLGAALAAVTGNFPLAIALAGAAGILAGADVVNSGLNPQGTSGFGGLNGQPSNNGAWYDQSTGRWHFPGDADYTPPGSSGGTTTPSPSPGYTPEQFRRNEGFVNPTAPMQLATGSGGATQAAGSGTYRYALVRVEDDGNGLIDWIDRGLAYRRR